ncbi:non-ribosomal peptide synthetase [Clostridium tagluense]|uniref:non-ribosomal peptide synthetase n=1 Tax=Clostridium tagluense TaxID=360422 RepID=UPI001CF2E689|nr:non-ribosomal peptide synthetase [Clostridium tagluense]MCB2298651.1 amino acid adenylation domain-containing protein [Clostridium tagluense]
MNNMVIKRENVEDIIELTSTQQGMLYHYVNDTDSFMYQEQLSITLSGAIDINLIKKTWDFLVESNEMLRTIFRWEKIDKPVQIILKDYNIPLEIIDLSQYEEDTKNVLFNNIYVKKMQEKVDISIESIKIVICKFNQSLAKIIIKNHHILFDGWSTGIILNEFISIYNSYLKGNQPQKMQKNKFKNFVNLLKQENKNSHREFWSSYLKNRQGSYQATNGTRIQKIETFIYKDKNKIKQDTELYAKRKGISTSVLLYVAWAILQANYENTQDVIFGTPISGRSTKILEMENMVGLFINSIPLRVRIDSNETINDFIKKVDNNFKQRLEYHNTPLLDIKRYGEIPGNEDIFTTMVVVENYPISKEIYNGYDAVISDYKISESTNFDLSIQFGNFDTLEIKCDYNEILFNKDYIIRMIENYVNILNTIINNDSNTIGDIEVVSKDEKQLLLHDFNRTKAKYPIDKTIQKLFEEQVEKTPNNIALRCGNKMFTYQQLNENANKLAMGLKNEYQVKSGDIIAINLERNVEMIIGIIATLKANAVCLPIETKYPIARTTNMIIDSNAKIIINSDQNLKYDGFDGRVVNYISDEVNKYPGKNFLNDGKPEDLAYLIYTSGSTGKPKAVMLNHRGIINHAFAKIKETNMTEKDVCCHNLSFNFVASIWQIFSPLFIGSKVYLYGNDISTDGYNIFKQVEEDNVSILEMVPSLLNSVLELQDSIINSVTLKNMRKIILTGEKVTAKLVNKFYGKYKVDLINAYGQSECSDDTLHYFIPYNTNTREVMVGKPSNNTEIFIIGTDNKLKPIGVPGELCISGDGVVTGYLNEEVLTRERFMENPYTKGKMMYKTGDLAKWLPDGNIQLLGRLDHQVKIRGFRIELDDIESNILKIDGIEEAIVIYKEQDDDKFLCVYYVSSKDYTVAELREELEKNIPDYMIPSEFIRLDKMPVNENGKIDRKSLPKYQLISSISTDYVEPKTYIERKLVEIWQEVLDKKKIGVHDNFFHLGGHSLKAMKLAAKINREFNIDIPLSEIFTRKNVRNLSEYIYLQKNNHFEEIEKVEERDYYETSSAQNRIYMLHKLNKQSTAYNMPGVIEIDGDLNIEKAEKIFNKLIQRHELLRMSFLTTESSTVQIIHKPEEISFKLEKIQTQNTQDIKGMMNSFIRPFDLEKAPLFRAGIIEVKEQKHILITDMHHIISDGSSVKILIEEFGEFYNGIEKEPLKIKYKDFVVWKNNKQDSEELKKQEEYWIKEFEIDIPVLNLPIDYIRPKNKDFIGDNINFTIGKEETRKLRGIARETGSTMYMVILSTLKILLSKYSGQDNIVVGTSIAGRTHTDIESITGMVVNTLAIRSKVDQDDSYREHLNNIKEKVLKAYENQDYQFEDLVSKLDIIRDLSRNPLFDVMFVMQNIEVEKIEGLEFKPYNSEINVAKFDLTMTAVDADSEIYISLNYATKLYEKETIERMVNHFLNIVKEIVKNTEVKINDIELISEEEKYKLLVEFNDTSADYPRDKTMHELFEEQVEKTPNNIAVVFEDKELTYRELNERANSLARKLREKGVGTETIVGVIVERSIEMIVGIMAILKVGGAYLPINPEYPEDRIDYILKNSETKIVLTQSKFKEKIRLEIDICDLNDEVLYKCSNDNLGKVANANNLAYLIYTSGTTGNPKGVMITHDAVVNTIQDINSKFSINEKDRIIGLSSVCFDLSVYDIFGALSTGATLVQISDQRDVREIVNVLKNQEVTIWNSVPAMMDMLLENITESFHNTSLRLVMLSGDWISLKSPKKIRKSFSNAKIVSLGGATEASIWSTYYPIEEVKQEWNSIPYGRPLANQKFYVLDKGMHLCPYGVIGEFYIGGFGLAKGYMNDLEKTKSAFIIHNEFGPLYRTGDWGRFRKAGYIEFLGRKDQQIKIRGFRIELGEIENRLLKHEDVKYAVVVVNENKNKDKYMYAYVVSEKEISELNLKSYLKESLPDYMIPSEFVRLDKLPVNENGKIDRKSLPKSQLTLSIGTGYVAPQTYIERKLVEIWGEMLGKNKIGVYDNFFHLGGHSLNVMKLATKINKEFDIDIPLSEIFIRKNVRNLSEYICLQNNNHFEEIEKVQESDYYETSSAQKRIYMLHKLSKQSTAYNMPGVIEIDGELNIEKAEKIFNKLIQRHESLRTRFLTTESSTVQIIHKPEEISFKLEKIQTQNIEDIKEMMNSFIRSFDLEKAPLFRAGIIEVKEQKYILIIDMHHIISDGSSVEILIKEFKEFYNGIEKEPLKIKYKDFVVWQNNKQDSEELKKQEEYWIKEFETDIPVLNLPIDYIRPKNKDFIGDNINFTIGKEETRKLREIARETGSTMYMVILSTLMILLSKYSGQDNIIVGTPIAGRNHEDLENIIGMFVNTLPIRSTVKGGNSFDEFLIEVKEKAIKVFENQEYQFEKLVEKLNVYRDLSRNPIFDVLFAFQNMDKGEIKIEGLNINTSYSISNVEKFDLTMTAFYDENSIKINMSYATSLYKKETIERMRNHFLNLIKKVVDDRRIKIKDMEIIGEEEKQKVLLEFNNTKNDYLKDKTLYQLFEEKVNEAPNNIALVCNEEKLTYKELNEKVNMLADKLRNVGVNRNTVVAIMTERSLEMIIGIFAILKSGGAYLPLDPKCPEDRLKYILEDSQAKLILTRKNSAENLEFFNNVLIIENELLIGKNVVSLENVNESTDLAYIIYTSGSTGRPKGVMIRHFSVINTLMMLQKEYSFTELDSYLLKTAYTFDVSITEIFGWFHGNGRLVILPSRKEGDPKSILEAIDRYNITHINFVPSMFNMFINGIDEKQCNILKKLKYVFVAGEAITNNIVQKFYELAGEVKLINLYGPTEASIYATKFSIEREMKYSNIPIGKPIQNTKIFILDKNEKLQPIGVSGELCISGDGLATGYVNMDDKTKDAFVYSSFDHNEKLYKTGDLARWLSDGNIEYLGRIDNQIKIRGFRIELGEIESTLVGIEGIDQAVVIDIDEENSKSLRAYIKVSKEGISVNYVKEQLSKILPEYMVPSEVYRVEVVPLNKSGKVDKKALKEIESIKLNFESTSRIAETKVEHQIYNIWTELLNKKNFGVNDSFFDLGGDSFKIIQMQSLIAREFNKDIEIVDLFNNYTIAKLVDHLGYLENKENKKELKYIKLLSQYFDYKNLEEQSLTLKYEFKDNNAINLKNYIKSNKISLNSFMLSIYSCLLRDSCDVDDVTVYTIYEKEQVREISFDFSNLDSIKQLYDYIEKGNFEDNITKIKYDNLIRHEDALAPTKVIPLFAYENSEFCDLGNCFDLILWCRELDDNIEVILECKNNKLSNENMKEFFKCYISAVVQTVQ